MKNAKIELKRVKLFKGHDGVGLDCDLYVNGVKIAHVFDSAHGGEVEYQAYGPDYKANNKMIEDLEEYARTLPEVPNGYNEGTLPQSLDSIINDILMKVEIEKQEKKMVKRFDTHIIAGVPNTGTYKEWAFGYKELTFGTGKVKTPLSALPVAHLQKNVNQIKAMLVGEERILNTNLQALGIVL
ncbi:MAG TPA: hypothetical protein VNX68_02845 [Nitrosopumilaceae archaeon]|jgi:hypothetical protein|nr:hypothetical protein [Nitrosopumilaceae archaeon]